VYDEQRGRNVTSGSLEFRVDEYCYLIEGVSGRGKINYKGTPED